MVVVFVATGCGYATAWGVFGWRLVLLPAWVYAVAASVGGVVFFLAPMVFGRGAIAGPGPDADDGKPLVLYLRPFEGHLSHGAQLLLGAMAGVFVWLGMRYLVFSPFALLMLVLNVTPEQRWHDALLPLGHLVAFSRPGARLQPVGAWRHRAGEDWRAELHGYLARASLVIVRPGAIGSIAWEVEQVLATVPADRILFDLRFRGGRTRRQRAWDDFRARVRNSRVAAELPERLEGARYLVFAGGRHPRFFAEPRHPVAVFRHFFWGDLNRERIAPALAALGIELPQAPHDRVTAASQLYLRICLYLFLSVVVFAVVMLTLRAISS